MNRVCFELAMVICPTSQKAGTFVFYFILLDSGYFFI